MTQTVRSTNPKHFELIISGLKEKGWRMNGKIKIVRVKGKQSFEVDMIRKKK